MRCTKCGYISFDHLQSCSHCSTNLQEVGALLKGTALEAEPAFFLSSLLEPVEEPEHLQEEEELVFDAEEEAATLDLDEEMAIRGLCPGCGVRR